MANPADRVLDNPSWAALRSRHSPLATHCGLAARYPADVSPLGGLAEGSEAALRDLASITLPGEVMALVGIEELGKPGPEWEVAAEPLSLVQMVCDRPLPDPDRSFSPLSERDVDEMLDLVAATQPGPFERRTVVMGRYVGLREDGKLIAMAGERMKPPGFTEISAVCTDPAFQGRGLGAALVCAIGAQIQAAGEVPFLHVLEANQRAISLYRKLGFEVRRTRLLTPLIRR